MGDLVPSLVATYAIGVWVVAIWFFVRRTLRKGSSAACLALGLLVVLLPGAYTTVVLTPYIAGLGEHLGNMISKKLGVIGFISVGALAYHLLVVGTIVCGNGIGLVLCRVYGALSHKR